jgi:hypothetical protein
LKKTKGRASAPKSSHEASHKTGQTAVAQRRSQARAVARKKTPTKGKGLKAPERVAEQLREYQHKGKVF